MQAYHQVVASDIRFRLLFFVALCLSHPTTGELGTQLKTGHLEDLPKGHHPPPVTTHHQT